MIMYNNIEYELGDLKYAWDQEYVGTYLIKFVVS